MAVPPRRALVLALVTFLLALHAWTAWTSTLGKGVAFDESAHLTAGYAYWTLNDYRLQPENGNLPQRWAGLAVMPLSPRLDPDAAPRFWSASDVWRIGQEFLYESGNSPELLLATSRAAMTLWGVAAGLLVFVWSRRLWGTAGGLLSLSLCAGSATVLAHAPLVTSDMCAAVCLLAATGAFWAFLEKPGRGRLAASLALTGLCAIAKFSFLLLPAIYAVLFFWHEATKPSALSRARLLGSLGRLLPLVILHAGAALLVIWAAFGFRYEAAAPGLPAAANLYVPWEELLPEQGARRMLLVALKEHQILPQAFTHGLAYVLRASEARGAFAAGEVSTTGWWWFFPYAFVLKSTFAELLVVIALAALATRRWIARKPQITNDLRRLAPLLVLLGVYGLASLTSNLNIGHRHILPLYLPLFVCAGALLHPGAGRIARGCAALVGLLLAVETTRTYPNYFSYFNAFAGPPETRFEHLVDSSLDWGQELPALASWLAANRRPEEPVYLTYFGVGDPRHEGISAIQFAPYSTLWRPPRIEPLEPGLYCVSATILQDSYSLVNGPWTDAKENTFQILAALRRDSPALFDGIISSKGDAKARQAWLFERLRFARLSNYLKLKKPEAVINSAILVYRLEHDEIAIAVDADTREFVRLLESAAEGRAAVKAAP